MKKINKKGELVGKSYATRKPLEERPEADFYETPKSLVWELLKTDELKNVKTILEPCCGNHAISTELLEAGYQVESKDIKYGNDFLMDDYTDQHFDAVVTNPPFSLWDDIILKAKNHADIVIAIGKTNFFGAKSRFDSGIWKNLKAVYIFSRQIDYQFPVQKDGSMGVGNLVTGWFVWDKNYTGDPALKFIDVQQYCKLGSFEAWKKKNMLSK